MSVGINLRDVLSYCCLCLKLNHTEVNESNESVPNDGHGLSPYDLLTECLLESSLIDEQSGLRGPICQKCFCSLTELHQYRKQCTEIYKFYEALLHAKDSNDEKLLLETLEDRTASNMRSHLFRLHIIPSEDTSSDVFLEGVHFRKEESSNDILANAIAHDSYSSDCHSECEIEQDSAGSVSCEEESIAEGKQKQLSQNDEDSVKCYTVCPSLDCLEVLNGQKYTDHLKESHCYGCKQCGLILTSKYTMGKHTTIHVQLPSTVKCSFCERMFTNLAKMRAHARDVHLQQAQNYECDECGTKFEKRKLLNLHCETHLPKDCHLCQTEFDHPSKLFNHMKKSHPEQLLNCKYCTRRFLTRSELDRHQVQHSVNLLQEDGYELLTLRSISIFVCSQCEKQFTSEAHRSAHMTSHDPASRPRIVVKKRSKDELNKLEKKYQCEQCDASYRLPSSLESHVKTHSVSPFVCDICGSFFKAKSYLKQHITYKHSRDFRYFCDFCPKACATSSDLLRHRRVHTNERPYQCGQCEARFKTNDGYRKHLRSHSGERIYRCDLCERRFMCHSSLKTHMISHTNEKAFKCFYCEQYFNVPKNRRRHILRTHPGFPVQQSVAE